MPYIEIIISHMKYDIKTNIIHFLFISLIKKAILFANRNLI